MEVQKMPIQTVIGATEVRNHFGQLLNRVYKGDEHLVVEKSGIPVAALISMRDYEEFRLWLAKRVMREMGQEMAAEFSKMGITTEEQVADIMEEDRKSVYQQYYGEQF